MERKNAKIRCDETMILSDGTTQVKTSVRCLSLVTYHLNGDDNDKKSKSYVQIKWFGSCKTPDIKKFLIYFAFSLIYITFAGQ